MDYLGPYRVKGYLGSRPNSPAIVEGEQASHAPSVTPQIPRVFFFFFVTV